MAPRPWPAASHAGPSGTRGGRGRRAPSQVRDRAEDLSAEIGADADEALVAHLLARLEVHGVGRLEVAFDGVVLEVDHGLAVVGDAALADGVRAVLRRRGN